MNPTKFAKRLKSIAMVAHKQGNTLNRRPERFRCYNVLIDYDFLSTGEWHMSVSKVPALKPSEADEQALAKLVEVLGVPEDKREGRVAAQQYRNGFKLPEVRHFIWTVPEDMN
jgi:hypothetical protein